MALSTVLFHPINLMEPYAAGSTSRRSGSPDWVLLHRSARFSDLQNSTTVKSKTRDGQAVEVSFWLVHPPGVSYFSVHCPCLNEDDFASEPCVICAEAALVLFRVTLNIPGNWTSTHHFVYRAGPGEPALHLLPDPNPNFAVSSAAALEFGLLPFHDEHYAVVFLNRHFTKYGTWHFVVDLFSSKDQAWSTKLAFLGLLSDSVLELLASHVSCKQIVVGSSSLGWVDLLRGILLLRNPSDKYPMIEYISFPVSRPCITVNEGYTAQRFRDVACCHNLIKFVDIEFHDRGCSRDKGWKASTWNMNIFWNEWRPRLTVEVADILVHPSYDALLPELRDHETQKVDLRKLITHTPTLSMYEDDFLYITCKVNDEDHKAWVIAVDMKLEAVVAVAPFPAKQGNLMPVYYPCAFPKHLNITPGLDVANPVRKYFKGMDAAKCALEILWTQDWLRELDEWLEFEGSCYTDCILLDCCPVSSLRFNIQSVVEYASCNGRGKAASEAVNVCLRVLQIAPHTMMARRRKLPDACHQRKGKQTIEHCEKPGDNSDYRHGFPDDDLLVSTSTSRSMPLSTVSFSPINLMEPYAAGSTAQRSGSPNWVLLHWSACISDLQNKTTVKSKTRDGQAIEVSFWLVEPPGVSYFSVHCPGLKEDDFVEEPYVICAEAALVLFCVTFNIPGDLTSTHHFVYRAGPGEPALHLLPDHNAPAYEAQQFGLLPCGGTNNEHYAVVFLRWNKTIGDHMFDVHVFSSQTQAWSSKVALLSLSESENKFFCRHDTCKQITIGSSLGWVDLLRGILVVHKVFDEYPVIKYIPFPESRPFSRDKEESDAPQYFRDVACCNNMIKFVHIESHDPCCTGNKDWKATTWNRKLSWGYWRQRFTVKVDDISVDQSYSALLPELWDSETGKLDLKKLNFYTPTLSMCDDDFLYVMSKVNDEDDKAWVITVDMKHEVVQAVAPFSAGDMDFLPMYCPCSFPKYLNMTPGAEITNLVHKYFKRMEAEKCTVELLWTQDWLMELDQCLELERSIYMDHRSLQWCPVSSLHFNIRAVVEYASSIGQGKAASRAVDVCLRALEDLNCLLRKLPSDALLSPEAMRNNITNALEALENVLQIAPPPMMAGGTMMDEAMTPANAPKRPKPIFERGKKPGHKTEHMQPGGKLSYGRGKKAGHKIEPMQPGFSDGKLSRGRGKKAGHKIEPMQPGFSDGKLSHGRGKKAGHEKDKCDDDQHQAELDRQLELNLHGSWGPWLSSLPQDVWFILAIAFSALVRACLRYLNS
ncbi:hypothetical protein VPH35_010846 [Triticum aestivum]